MTRCEARRILASLKRYYANARVFREPDRLDAYITLLLPYRYEEGLVRFFTDPLTVYDLYAIRF